MNFSITDVLAEVQQEPYSLGFSQTALSAKDTKVLEALQKAYPKTISVLQEKRLLPVFTKSF